MDDLVFGKSDHTEVLEDLEGAMHWLRSLGIRTNGKRHEHYAAVLRDVVAEREAGDFAADPEDERSRQIAVAILESDQLIRVWRGFSDRDTEPLVEKLRTLAKGPADFRDETPSSNKPRNVGFELDCAASLSAAGCEIIPRSRADVDVFFRGTRYLMECKRPLSHRGLKARMKQAVGQLVTRFEASPVVSYGLLAFSVGRLYWPSGLIVTGDSPAQIRDRVVGWTKTFDKEYARRWVGRDERIIGAIIDCPFLGRLNGTDIWLRGHIPVIVALCSPGSEGFAHVAALQGKMMSGRRAMDTRLPN